MKTWGNISPTPLGLEIKIIALKLFFSVKLIGQVPHFEMSEQWLFCD